MAEHKPVSAESGAGLPPRHGGYKGTPGYDGPWPPVAPKGPGGGSPGTAESDVLADLRDALDKIAAASRVIVVHPARESSVREAVAASPFPGLLEVAVTGPPDKVFVIPKTEAAAWLTRDTTPARTQESSQ